MWGRSGSYVAARFYKSDYQAKVSEVFGDLNRSGVALIDGCFPSWKTTKPIRALMVIKTTATAATMSTSLRLWRWCWGDPLQTEKASMSTMLDWLMKWNKMRIQSFSFWMQTWKTTDWEASFQLAAFRVILGRCLHPELEHFIWTNCGHHYGTNLTSVPHLSHFCNVMCGVIALSSN